MNERLLVPDSHGPEQKIRSLREAIDGGVPLVLPGVYDAITARLAEEAGFRALYLTGAGLANSQLCAPDVGLLSLDLIVTQAMRICAATTIPLIVDIDTGFGGPISVMNAVRTLEAVGAAGVQIEDQVAPKRCGHFAGKAVIDTASMQMKVDAATRARRDSRFVVIARTDAIAINGVEDAIARAHAYREAGADVLFVEAPESVEDLTRLPGELPGIPLLANVVPGGLTPELSNRELSAMGYSLILHANVVLRTMIRSVGEALKKLGSPTDAPIPAQMYAAWDERQRLVGLADYDALEDDLAKRWMPEPSYGGL